MSDWKDFELLIKRIQDQVSEDAEVKHNEHILGKTGTKRQLDITVRKKIGLVDVLIVFECKKYTRPVDLGKVASFAQKLKDVDASQGIMVSSSGFTQGAKNTAIFEGIKLLSFRQADETDWSELLGENAWAGLILVRVENYKVSGYAPEKGKIEVKEKYILQNKEGQKLKKIKKIVERALKMAAEQLKPVGNFKIDFTLRPTVYIDFEDDLIPIDQISVSGEKSAFLVPVNIKLASGGILSDAIDDEELYSELLSESIDWRERLFNSPGRYLSEEEYDELFSNSSVPPATLDFEKTKRYLRISFTKKKSNGT